MNATDEYLRAIMFDYLNGKITLDRALHEAFNLGHRGSR